MMIPRLASARGRSKLAQAGLAFAMAGLGSGGLGLAVGWPAAQAATFDCVINPSMTLKIGSPVSTTLQSVEVQRGDHVTHDQVIARLESTVQAADVAVDEARAANTADVVSHGAKLEFAQAEDSRGEKLLENNNIPRQKVDELRTNLRVAQEDMQIAVLNHRLVELDLARSRALAEQRIIRSPIDAVVVQRLLGPGEFVHQDSQIVELAAIDPLNVEVYPPVRYFAAIKPGMKGTVQPDAPVNQVYDATVTIVDHVFDAASGTFGVRLALPNPAGLLPAGLRCRVTLDTGDDPTNSQIR
jgi:RND family efflux transporter MFP subunit